MSDLYRKKYSREARLEKRIAELEAENRAWEAKASRLNAKAFRLLTDLGWSNERILEWARK